MGLTIGIDIGATSTKIVGWDGTQVLSPCSVQTADPVASLYGALGKYMHNNGIATGDVRQVALTGVGAAGLSSPVFDLPTHRVDEFIADGMGARFLSGLTRAVVVSMGTGTTLVKVDGNDIAHLGGISMGGGTLQGMGRLLLGTTDVGQIVEMASHGDISHINLQIKDISAQELDGLPLHATASLFAKAARGAVPPADVAKGLIWMVLETIGSSAVLSQINGGIADFVLMGKLTCLPECGVIFPMMESLYGVRFHTPRHAEHGTAVGAALAASQHD